MNLKRWILVGILVLVIVQGVSAATHLDNFYTTNATEGTLVQTGSQAEWATLHNGAGDATVLTDAANIPGFRGATDADRYEFFRRGVELVDTSALPDDCTIDNVTLYFYREASSTAQGDTGVAIFQFTIDGSLDAADYNNFNYTPNSAYQNISTLSSTGWYHWHLNDYSWISKTGSTGFGILLQNDVVNAAPQPWVTGRVQTYFQYSANESITNSPYVVIGYTEAAAPPDPPVAAFSCTPTSFNGSTSVTCTDSSAGGAPSSWAWYYTNATISADTLFASTQNPSYTFPNVESVYNIKLNASNTGGYDWQNETGYLTSHYSPVPVPMYSVNRTYAFSKPAGFQFTDTSTNALAWNWSFGDGSYSTSQNPAHAYTDYGQYHINLTVQNNETSVSNATISNVTGSIGIIDPHGWSDNFTVDSSAEYGDQDSGFIWDTTNKILNASSGNSGNSEQIYYLASPFFNGTYEYNFTVTERNTVNDLYGVFIFGSQDIYQDQWYQDVLPHYGTKYTIYSKNQTPLEDRAVVCLDFVQDGINGGTDHVELTCANMSWVDDHEYHVVVNWTPFATEKINVSFDGVTTLTSTDSQINQSGLVGFARHVRGDGGGTFWYDDLEVNPEGDNTTTPVASFTKSRATVTIPQTVTFTDTSTNTPTSWAWYWYANETVSNTTQNPTDIEFTTVGTVNVRLWAENAAGGDWYNDTLEVQAETTYGTGTSGAMSSQGITVAIVGGLSLVGILLLGAGVVMVLGMFRNGTMGRGGVATSPEGMGIGIAAIAMGALLLFAAYIILSPIFTIAGA